VTYHFPDAYAGTNTKIRDTLNNLILKSPQSWQTSVGLPFFQIQGTVVEWDEVRFGEIRVSPLRPSSAMLIAVLARAQMCASCSACPMRVSRACKPRCAGATAIAWSAAGWP
jgi:hypothetical protein